MGFDLDAFIASRDPGPFTFTFGGQQWVWPPTLDVRAAAYLMSGDVTKAMEMQFGNEQYERFLATGGGLDDVAIAEIFRAHAKHIGSGLGESSASPPSSKNTARPSKRTSKKSTVNGSRPSAPVSPGAV